MTRALAILVALAAIVAHPATAQPAPPPARAQSQAEAATQATGREILVMLRLPAAHLRPNARYGGRYDDRAAQQGRRRVAAQIARDTGLELLDGWPMPLIGVDCYVMRAPEGRSIDEVIGKVSRHPMVAWAQPLHAYHSLAAPAAGDPLLPVQPAATEWHLAQLHAVSTGKGVVVAVIDSKVDTAHPDLAGQFAGSRDFVSSLPAPAEQHGTAIAGVIAAKAGNSQGIAGVAPDVRLLALRACSETRHGGAGYVSTCDSLTLAKALEFALEHGAQVINMSLSGPPDALLAALIGVGLERRIPVVAAFDPARPDGGFPASVPGVVPVADESSSSLPQRVYRAPGRDVPTTQPGGRWYLVNGNSFAAAHISGLLALVRQARGAADAGRLARSASGTVDACASVLVVTSTCDCACAIGRATHGAR